MADIRKFMNMNNGGGDSTNAGEETVPVPRPAAKSKKGTIENTYQKVTQLEHVLLRPDTYIGSVERMKDNMWIYDAEENVMVQKEIEYTPGLYKIFDEILVNAADNKQRDPKMDCIKIEIKPDDNLISVWNNGKGIPVAMHKDEKMYVPTMIFGHLLTSSNYNDDEQKVTGGRNGYGAKLCNIFSKKFVVETASIEFKRQFKQTWGSNMTKTSEPSIKDFWGDDFTKITFSPDLDKFKMTRLDDDIVSLMSRRAFDIAASARGVKVFLNGKRLPVKNFKDYIELYTKGKEDESGNPLKIVYEQCDPRWEIAMTVSHGQFQQVSFVNSIATTKGGRHVDYVAEMITKQLVDSINKKNKGGIKVKSPQVKNYMWIFVNCLIVNPTFDSQTKENMTLQAKSFGSKCAISEKFMTQVAKSGIIDSVLSWARHKQQTALQKQGGKKIGKLKGVPKLEDANEAGSRNALKCTLILTEGDSAKTIAVSGLSVIGRDYYGVFPLRGKLLNVRECTHKQRMENAEINNVVKILGLQYKKKYNTPEDMKTLRYGKVMLMTDQDLDGSHIKGLFINFVHYNWPELIQNNFLEEFITPIVKAKKGNQSFDFYSMPEFEEWKKSTPNHRSFKTKYYKGLGTIMSVEAKEYFQNMDKHRIPFRYTSQQDDDHIVLAFSKKHVEHRKEWLTNFMTDSKRRKELGIADTYLYGKSTKFVTYKDFINMELVLYSIADNVRSIPSMVDGFKPGQRKVVFTCIKRNDKHEIKVAQLAGSVGEQSAYHHGEQSLAATIVNLAQNFVGSNNLNVLMPIGQFGTRLSGGKDSASPRYIYTKMSPLTRLVFHPKDDALLKHEYDDNLKIEPEWYIPIIPMLLVNGADGIGTGWMTKMPNYDPRAIVENIRRLLDGDEMRELTPFYKNFKGTIQYCGEGRYAVSGEIAIIGPNKVEITELPVGMWTQNYKESVLEVMLHGTEKAEKEKKGAGAEKAERAGKEKKPTIGDYKEYSTDTTVRFVVTLLDGQLEAMQKNGGLHKAFKLQSMISTGSMCSFDQFGCLRKFDSVMDVMKDFYTLRLEYYQKRKNNLEGTLQAEADRLSDQARFIMEKCNGKLVVENKKRKAIVEELRKCGYRPDPVKVWKERSSEPGDENEEASQAEEASGSDEEGSSSKKTQPKDEIASEAQMYDYLLGMSMWMLTEERKNELLQQRDNKLKELDILKKKSKSDLWREDLDIFMEKLDEVEAKERAEEAGTAKGAKGQKKPVGKKKLALQDLMPSPTGQRIVPTITDDMKKKIELAVKSKESREKRAGKKDVASIEDSDDELLGDQRPLAERLGVVDEKKTKGKAKKADGLKQTKLNFKKKSPDDKVNGSPKKRGRKKFMGSDSEEDDNLDSDNSIESPGVKERFLSRRAATKVTNFREFDDGEDLNLEESGEEELHDNEAIKEQSFKATALSSDSEHECPPPAQVQSPDDQFDLLIGRKKETAKNDSDSDMFASPKKVQPKQTKRKKIEQSTGSDSEDMFTDKVSRKNTESDDDSEKESKKKATAKKTAGPARKRAAPKSKKIDPFEDSDDSPKKKTKGRKKKAASSSDEEFNLDDSFENVQSTAAAAPTRRGGRGAKKTYVYSDESD